MGRRGGEPGCDGLGWGSRRCEFVPLREISPNLQHAVVSAEDARFYLHHGFDWHQVQIDAAGDLEGGRVRQAGAGGEAGAGEAANSVYPPGKRAADGDGAARTA